MRFEEGGGGGGGGGSSNRKGLRRLRDAQAARGRVLLDIAAFDGERDGVGDGNGGGIAAPVRLAASIVARDQACETKGPRGRLVDQDDVRIVFASASRPASTGLTCGAAIGRRSCLALHRAVKMALSSGFTNALHG